MGEENRHMYLAIYNLYIYENREATENEEEKLFNL